LGLVIHDQYPLRSEKWNPVSCLALYYEEILLTNFQIIPYILYLLHQEICQEIAAAVTGVAIDLKNPPLHMARSCEAITLFSACAFGFNVYYRYYM
jgi:hypothetical protein